MLTKKSIIPLILLSLIVTLPSKALAVSEKEILDAYEKAVSYSYERVMSSQSALEDLKNDYRKAKNLLNKYIEDIVEFEDYEKWEEVESFFYAIDMCDEHIWAFIYQIQYYNGGYAKEERELAKQYLAEAKEEYEKLPKEKSSSSSSNCFIRALNHCQL